MKKDSDTSNSKLITKLRNLRRSFIKLQHLGRTFEVKEELNDEFEKIKKKTLERVDLYLSSIDDTRIPSSEPEVMRYFEEAWISAEMEFDEIIQMINTEYDKRYSKKYSKFRNKLMKRIGKIEFRLTEADDYIFYLAQVSEKIITGYDKTLHEDLQELERSTKKKIKDAKDIPLIISSMSQKGKDNA
ncbi:MAG: hypothetical protein LBI63_00225 [Candidatus Ancillula sp.]|jgi:hypothetical protein|nr:hypothetical protein [Candidatus Ancillula sp.]